MRVCPARNKGKDENASLAIPGYVPLNTINGKIKRYAIPGKPKTMMKHHHDDGDAFQYLSILFRKKIKCALSETDEPCVIVIF